MNASLSLSCHVHVAVGPRFHRRQPVPHRVVSSLRSVSKWKSWLLFCWHGSLLQTIEAVDSKWKLSELGRDGLRSLASFAQTLESRCRSEEASYASTPSGPSLVDRARAIAQALHNL
jgi:hypothetical protein